MFFHRKELIGDVKVERPDARARHHRAAQTLAGR
jgi:hypothetical protein